MNIPTPAEARRLSDLLPDVPFDVEFTARVQWVDDRTKVSALGEIFGAQGVPRRRTIRIIAGEWVSDHEPTDP